MNRDKKKGNDNKFHKPVAAFVFMSHIGLPTFFFVGLRTLRGYRFVKGERRSALCLVGWLQVMINCLCRAIRTTIEESCNFLRFILVPPASGLEMRCLHYLRTRQCQRMMKLRLLSPESLGLSEKEITRILGPQTFTEIPDGLDSLETVVGE
ncbi:hypothetical protein P5673_025413 [Acropora cervicornis]|uniref:Uncharacterized protein n=1 Tax=Acropora cervicornis TaxID=6130 RepID=A0AAD9UX60_ACRCE|nr:hypothetical protein P5673_025413 [Acropora cervicornis]